MGRKAGAKLGLWAGMLGVLTVAVELTYDWRRGQSSFEHFELLIFQAGFFVTFALLSYGRLQSRCSQCGQRLAER